MPLFIVAHCAHHLLIALPVPLLPHIRDDFGLDYTRSGLLVSAFALSYGISQLPAGWLADRIGARILITVGICGVAAAGFLVGFSQTYIMAAVFLALMGVVGGGYHPAATPLISASVRPENRGQALGFHMIGGSSSFFLAPLVAAGISAVWGWRGSFIALAVPSFVFGAVFFRFLGRMPGSANTVEVAGSVRDEATAAPIRLGRLVPVIIISGVTVAAMRAIITFIPLFMVDHFGVTNETAAALISVIYSAGLWSGPLGGYLSDRFGNIPVTVVVCLTAGPVFYLVSVAPYGLAFGFILVMIGVINYMRQPATEAYLISQTTPRNRSTILGVYYFLSVEGSGVLTPIMGYIVDRLGFYAGFTIIGAALEVVVLVCSIWLWAGRD